MNFLITGRYKLRNNKASYYLDEGWSSFFKKIRSNYKLYKKNFSKKKILKFDCLIISGGGDIYKISKNKLDKNRDKSELNLIKIFEENKKPIIVICRGFQLLGSYYKNKLLKIENHVRTTNSIKIQKNLYLKTSKILSNSYHNYGFFKLNEKFKIIGRSTDKSIELAEMRGKKILCMMFHPERYNASQRQINILIKNFIYN